MKFLAFILLTFATGSNAFGESGFAIIANNAIAQTSISTAELKAILFGNRSTIDGVSAEPCLWGAPQGEAFFKNVLGVGKTQFSQEWVKKELTGAGRAPRSRDNPEDVINCVASGKGGIGFIPSTSVGAAAGKVKILELKD